jgi:hypothetical protein
MGVPIGEDAIEKGLILAARAERQARIREILRQAGHGDDLGLKRVIAMLAEVALEVG